MAMESLGDVKSSNYFQNTAAVKPAATVEKEESSVKTEKVVKTELNDSILGQVENSNQIANQNQSGDKQPGETSMKSISKDLNKILNTNTIAEFSYHEPSNRIIIKIKDKTTNEVIKEIPSEKALELLEKAWELAGILVDEKG